jgi:2-polyprenyl-3-methyl-5-hydroxy-6-metoxy-1,4-benzoquinol methylase
VVFNSLVSLSDTLVSDRGRFQPGSPAARVLEAIDRNALRSADLVVADTQAQARYLGALAGIESARVAVCLVGAEERVFTPGWAPREPFTCLFVGKLIPLHGLETILQAARVAPEIAFRIVGSGQLSPLLAHAPPNVEHVPWVEYERLPGELKRAGCALGIFGQSAKAARVIPNKAYQALACGTPLVTSDTGAARELLVNGESALLVPSGNPEALAAAVRRIASDSTLAESLSQNGLSTYREHASEDVLGQRWRAILEGLAQDHGQARARHRDRHVPGRAETHEWGSAPDFIGPRHDLRERLLLDVFLAGHPGRRVLDVGAGQGSFSRLIASRGFDVLSTDVSGAAVEHLRRYTSGDVVEANATHLSFPSHSFDAVVLGEVLEHLDDDLAALLEAARVLKPRGIVCASVPANPAWFGPSDAWAGHRRRYTRERLTSAFTAAGLDIETCVGWGFPVSAFYHRRLYEPRLVRRGPARPGSVPKSAFAALRLALQVDRLFVGVERGALGYLVRARG